jgi:hypothetical protein
MSNARLRLAFVGETMFPQVLPRRESAGADSRLAKGEGAPFFSRAWGTSRFPTPLPAYRPEAGR